MCNNNDEIRRPVNRADLAVIFTELFFNFAQAMTVFFESFYEIAMYHAKREATINRVWEDFNNDLETLPEDIDGAS